MAAMTRRTFVSGATAAAAGTPLLRNLDRSSFQARAAESAAALSLRVHPFELKRVRLRRGPFLAAAEINRRYMMSLEPDSLLHMFRITAGQPSSAKPLGGWEQPENELRGHFTGHYLSACALVYSATGDESFKTRGDKLVTELARCQKA